MFIRYSLVSKRNKNGEIVHDYKGRSTENSKFSIISYQAKEMEKIHEQLMNKNFEISRLETKVTEKYEKKFLDRLLAILPPY